MSGPAAGSRGWALPLGIAAGLAGVAVLVLGLVPQPEPLPVLATLKELDLVDQDGRPFTLARTKGRPWVASFLFTTCPSVCPKIAKALGELQERAPGLALVSFTVDPETDTPAVLKRYAEGQRADPARWTFVTGELAKVEALVRGGFMSPMDPTTADGVKDITHSARLMLMDKQNRLRAIFDLEPESLARLIEAAERLAEEDG